MSPEATTHDWMGRFADRGADSDAPLVIFDDRVITSRDVAASAAWFAGWLHAQGLARGDRVAVSLQNVPEAVIAMLGTWWAGCVLVPMNPMLRASEAAHVLTDSGAKVLVLEAGNEQLADEVPVVGGSRGLKVVVVGGNGEVRWSEAVGEPCDVVRPASGDVSAVIAYTSGTTGRPKGAVITHGNLAAQAALQPATFGLDENDVILGMAPLFHITGLVIHLVLALATGCPLVLLGRFTGPGAAEAIRKHGCTFAIGSITAYLAIEEHLRSDPSADVSPLTKAFSGGAPVSPAVVERFESATGIYIHNAYGMTESASATLVVPPGERAPVDPVSGVLSVGMPLARTEARVVDENGENVEAGTTGELLVRGPQVFAGYWGNASATGESLDDGWLRTGDVARVDDGWIFLVDRLKDMVIVSGYKVWPLEVETVLLRHPDVRQVAVLGAPDDYRGETVRAVVVRETGAGVTADDIEEFCRARLAAYKVPRVVDFVDALPVSAAGKVLKRELRDAGAP